MNEPEVTLRGHAVEDPVRRRTRAGDCFVTFRFASTPWRYDAVRREYADGETLFATVSAFKGLGRGVEESIRKGHPLVVHGRLRLRPWTNGERSGAAVGIEAIAVGHDLNRGSSRFVRHGQDSQHSSTAAPAGGKPDHIVSIAAGSATEAAAPASSDLEHNAQPKALPPPIDPATADTDQYVVKP